MGDGSKEDEIGGSRESADDEVRWKHRLRRKNSGDDFTRSKKRDSSGTKEKRRGGKNPHGRQPGKAKNDEGSGADLDSSINSIEDSDESGEDTFQVDETNPKERRSLLRRSTSANQMGTSSEEKETELAPADQLFNSRVGGSSSMRVARTTFESSFPAVKAFTVDDFASTAHNPKEGNSGKDRQPSFMKSLGDKLGATKTGTLSKGARNLIIGGIGGGNRTEKRRLLDDDDSVLS